MVRKKFKTFDACSALRYFFAAELLKNAYLPLNLVWLENKYYVVRAGVSPSRVQRELKEVDSRCGLPM